MKVLIVYPYFLEKRIHEEDIQAIPMGAYYVGAMLKNHGHDVEILNWYDMGGSPEKIKQVLKEKAPEVLGFSIVNANRWGAIEIARMAKKLNPKVTVVFGGIGATFLWKHLLTHFHEIDYTVIGEGEHSFLNLVSHLENDDSKVLPGIAGIAYRTDDTVQFNPQDEPIRDLDNLPMPANYFTFQHLSLTRGCPGNCNFCGSPKFWKKTVRFHSSEYFVRQIEHLYRKGVSFFYVSDDTFTLKKDVVIEICKKIIERKLPVSWAAICRVRDIDEDVLYWMRRAGCIQISYGIESGSEKIRKRLNKPLNIDRVKTAFELTTAYGIMARGYFIYGSPGETWETIDQTLELIHAIKPLSAIFYILDIFPGTALYEQFKARTGETDDIWLKRMEDILYYETDPKLTADQVMAFGKKLRTDFFKNISRFVQEISLVDKKELYPLHADFLSRMAMTFSHGDYASIDIIENKNGIAETLYKRALKYFPDRRAFLGLGILYQRQGAYSDSVEILSDGIRRFPSNEQLYTCLGVGYMNIGDFDHALKCFEKFPHSIQASNYVKVCRGEIGRQ